MAVIRSPLKTVDPLGATAEPSFTVPRAVRVPTGEPGTDIAGAGIRINKEAAKADTLTQSGFRRIFRILESLISITILQGIA
jgi:hypothetical protein